MIKAILCLHTFPFTDSLSSHPAKPFFKQLKTCAIQTPCFDTIQHLRSEEEIILFNRISQIAPAEEALLLEFLETEYQNECLDYPFTPPQFQPAAAIWAARTLYFSAQLLLYRENKEQELPILLPAFTGEINPSAILSADLCLRFLPDIVRQSKDIDIEDRLNHLLETILYDFHYSGIGLLAPTDTMQWNDDPCLSQLYLNRVVQRRAAKLAEWPPVKAGLLLNMGNFATDFMKTI